MKGKLFKSLNFFWVFLGLVLFVGDLFLKNSALSGRLNGNLPDGLVFFPNYGIAFSLPLPAWLAAWLAPVLIFVLFVFIKKRSHPIRTEPELALFFVSLGALSNFWDRLKYGFVIDYWHFLNGYFNLADLMIFFGFLGLIIYLRLEDKDFQKDLV